MMGTESSPGIIPLFASDLFRLSDSAQCTIKASFMEIYMERVYDLLGDPESTEKLRVRYHLTTSKQLTLLASMQKLVLLWRTLHQ